MSGTESMETLLEAVTELARLAGDTALAHFRAGVAVELKGDGSPVTIADRAAERAARDWLATRFPADGILGEEYGAERPEARRRWILDPIDGTKSFIHGVPLWGTLIAVAEGDDVLAGAINCAASGDLVAAARGAGCWWNGTRSHVSDVSELAAATVRTTDERFVHAPERRDAWLALADGARLSRSWGDCFGYLLVATGRAEAMMDPAMAAWDSAALQPVIEEAGGVFTDWGGSSTAFGGSAIATNARLAGEVRRTMGVTV
jgi:histidinol phosphatase-like enzyme (inositol monophosphatase family)